MVPYILYSSVVEGEQQMYNRQQYIQQTTITKQSGRLKAFCIELMNNL